MEQSSLDDEFLLLVEDISEFLPFPHLDQHPFELEHLPSPELIVDCPDFLDDSVDRVEVEGTGDNQEGRDSTENKNKKRKRGPGRPKKSPREKREAANSREKKRMRALVRLRKQAIVSWSPLTPITSLHVV